MTNKIIFLFLSIFYSFIIPQTTEDLHSKIEKLTSDYIRMTVQLSDTKNHIQKLEMRILTFKDSLMDLKMHLLRTNNNLQMLADSFGFQIRLSDRKSNENIASLSETISKSTLYWIIAVLSISLIMIILFVVINKKLKSEKTDLIEQIKLTSNNLREEQIKLDGQLLNLLDTQIQIMKEEHPSSLIPLKETDHSLALKVADEIIRIQHNLFNMDQNTKGIKQLSSSVKRIQANFEANGYEIIDMLNKVYDAGMRVTANFKPDERLKPDEQIITRIIKPQVNFKGVMIQSAQIEVSQGE